MTFLYLITYLFHFISFLLLFFISSRVYFFISIKEHPLKKRLCNFKIGKITYSKSSWSVTTYDDSKNKLNCIFKVLCFKWSKNQVAKILPYIWATFLYKTIVTIIPTNLVKNSLSCLFSPVIEIKNKNQLCSKKMFW